MALPNLRRRNRQRSRRSSLYPSAQAPSQQEELRSGKRSETVNKMSKTKARRRRVRLRNRRRPRRSYSRSTRMLERPSTYCRAIYKPHRVIPVVSSVLPLSLLNFDFQTTVSRGPMRCCTGGVRVSTIQRSMVSERKLETMGFHALPRALSDDIHLSSRSLCRCQDETRGRTARQEMSRTSSPGLDIHLHAARPDLKLASFSTAQTRHVHSRLGTH